MCCIACAQLSAGPPFPPRRSHQSVGRSWVVERHHQVWCGLKVQTPTHRGCRDRKGVAVVVWRLGREVGKAAGASSALQRARLEVILR